MTKLHVLRPHLPTGPLTRGECREWVLPCELRGCRYNLRGPGDRVPLHVVARYRSCALNIVEATGEEDDSNRGAQCGAERTIADVASLTGVTAGRASVTEQVALRKLLRSAAAQRAYRESDGIADRQGASLPSSPEE